MAGLSSTELMILFIVAIILWRVAGLFRHSGSIRESGFFRRLIQRRDLSSNLDLDKPRNFETDSNNTSTGNWFFWLQVAAAIAAIISCVMAVLSFFQPR